ncbi:MAG TPA: UbiA family prenyltransferase [Chitinophagaceae bacterium]
MKQFIHTIVYGSVFISLCTVGLCMETSLLLHLPFNNFPFYLLVFAATLGQYNIHYFIKKTANLNSERFRWSASHRGLHLIFNVFGAIGVIIGLFFLGIKHFMVLGIIAAITILYSFPFLPFPNKKRLKDFGILKILILSYVWTLITVWFPVVTLTRITPGFQIVFYQRFVFMFILCLAFDVRDIETDSRDHIQTLPVMVGKRWSYWIMYVSLVLFVALSLFDFQITHQFMQLNAMIVSALATYFMIEYSRTNDTDMTYLAGIDGMMLLQALLVGIAAIG